MLFLGFVVAAVAAHYDCAVDPRQCSGHGECGHHHGSAIPFCICTPGFRGVSCSVPPPRLPRAWSVPGRVDAADVHYRVEGWHMGDELELNRLLPAAGTTPRFVAAIGRVPTASDYQFAAWSTAESQSLLKLTVQNPRNEVLFVTVLGFNDSSHAVFEIFFDKGGEREDSTAPSSAWSLLALIAGAALFGSAAAVAAQWQKMRTGWAKRHL